MSLATKSAMARRRPIAGRPGQYQGDPGILGGILGGIGGFLTGGPVGAVAGALGGFKGVSKPPATTPGLSAVPTSGLLANFGGGSQLPAAIPRPGVSGAVQRILPGGESGYMSAGVPKGMRLNKSGYWLKSGEYVPPGTRYVKSRRRNPLNPKAASRAISRLESAKKAVKRLNRITIRKATSCR